jgi:hypothetical protein
MLPHFARISALSVSDGAGFELSSIGESVPPIARLSCDLGPRRQATSEAIGMFNA